MIVYIKVFDVSLGGSAKKLKWLRSINTLTRIFSELREEKLNMKLLNEPRRSQ